MPSKIDQGCLRKKFRDVLILRLKHRFFIPVSGKANDSYVISGWVCGNPLPKNDNRAFGVELEFTYSDGSKEAFTGNFASDSNQWQYVNKVVVAKKDYTSVKASYLLKNNANKVYFDGLSVYRDEYWPSFTYDDKGNVISCTDARNKKTTFAYDEKNNITKVTTPTGANFKYVYDSKHNITEATTATNKKYKFAYDSHGNVTSVRIVHPDNENQYIESGIAYTGDGNYVSKNTDCFGKETTYEYDTASGNLKSVTDVNGKKTSYAYDLMGRLTSVSRTNKVNGADVTVANTYTYENDRLKTIGHNGMNYTFGYDSFGNLTQAQAGSRTLVTNTFKMNGTQLEKSILGNNTGTSYEYDQYDRVVREKSVKSDGAAVTEYEYLYDHDGNLAGVTDKVNNEKQHYFYSISNQLARAESSTGASVQYGYDENDALKTVRATYDQVSKQMSYEYDADYNETKTTTMGGKTLTSEYDALGRVITKRLNTDNQFTVTYGYRDGANGSSSAMIQSVSNNGRSISYLYHDDGNIRQIQTPWTTQTFEYDAIGQLIRVNDDDTGHTTVYSYDAGGNMTSEKVYSYTTAAEPATEALSQRTFTYDTAWKDQMLTCGGKALTYDGAGNLLSYDGTTFTWTKGRRLSGVTKADGTAAAYTYNHNGQRASKTVGGVKHTYFYSGNLLIREKAGSLDMRFSYDSVGNPVSILYNDVEYYYVKNLQGDIIGLIDIAGTWVVEYSYDVWGNIRNVFGSMASTLGQDNPIRYRGYYYDNETKLYYVLSRYYSPELCRFINPDRYVSTGRGINGCNMYVYCENNSVNRIDILGECWYDAKGNWRHDSWEYIGNYERKAEPKTKPVVDITWKLTSEMRKNAAELREYERNYGLVWAALYFINKVKTGGDWDLKNQERWHFNDNFTYTFNGVKLRNDDIGNIHYGYVGRELFGIDILLIGGGAYQVKTDFPNIQWNHFYALFDDPRDQLMVIFGALFWDIDGVNSYFKF